MSKRDYIIFQKLLWGFNPSATRKNLYDNEHTKQCPLCSQIDHPYHFLGFPILWESPRGQQQFKILKSKCAKIVLSPFIWDIFKQAMHLDDVSIPEGLPKNSHIQVIMILKNQKELGWKNFLLGRITRTWKLVQRIKTSDSANGTEELPIFWGHLF